MVNEDLSNEDLIAFLLGMISECIGLEFLPPKTRELMSLEKHLKGVLNMLYDVTLLLNEAKDPLLEALEPKQPIYPLLSIFDRENSLIQNVETLLPKIFKDYNDKELI